MAENTVRQFAERGSAVAEEAKKGMEQAYATASKGAVDFNLQLIDMVQANMNAAFDLARQLSRVKSPSEFFEVSTILSVSRSLRSSSSSAKSHEAGFVCGADLSHCLPQGGWSDDSNGG